MFWTEKTRRLLAQWRLTRNSKGFSLSIRTFAAKNVTPLKDCQAAFGRQQGSHTDTTDDSPLIEPKRKKNKPPSTVARDRARSLRFLGKKNSNQTTSLDNARRQPV